MKRWLFVFVLALLTLGLTACPMTEEPTEDKIPAVAQGNSNLSTLVQALTKANLVEALNGDGPFTVFAPTNEAFAALLTAQEVDSLDALITKLGAEAVADILKYHVVSGVAAKSTDLTNGQEVTTLQGSKIKITIADGKVSLNDGAATVTTPDVEAANGVVHVIDKVLLPPPALKTIADTAAGDARFSTLVSALGSAGLVETLEGPGPFTVFAPTNDAFAKLAAVPEGDALKRVLLYHVIGQKLEAKDVIASAPGTATTVQGSTFSYAVVNNGVVLTDGQGNTINVTATDIQASNGVIHVIDSVLLPPDPASVPISLVGTNEVPPVNDLGRTGTATVTLDGNTLTVEGSYEGFNATAAHIHGPAAAGANAAPIQDLTFTNGATPGGTFTGSLTLTAQQLTELNDGLYYINVHSQDAPNGQIRGQIIFPQ
jgi:transforming growth factor-beta-induced protein